MSKGFNEVGESQEVIRGASMLMCLCGDEGGGQDGQACM